MTKITRLVIDGFKSFGKFTELEFGDRFNVILGPNGSGKCTKGDTLVYLSDGSVVRIDELVNSQFEKGNTTKLDDGFMIIKPGTKILSLDAKTLKVVKRPVQAFVKRTSPDNLVKIKTRSGREITATEYHPLFVLDGKRICSTRADELKTGTRIAVPRTVDFDNQTTFYELIDLLSANEKVYVPFDEKHVEILKQIKSKSWSETSSKLGIPVVVLKGFLSKQSIKFSHLVKILRRKLSKEELIETITHVKSKNSSVKYKIPWNNSPELARLIGYLIAEGRIPEDVNHIWFTNGTEEVVKDYINCFEKVFEAKPSLFEYKPNAWDVIGYGESIRFLLSLFANLCGSGNKKLTNLYLSHCSNKEIAELLNGMYCGDGYISKSSIELTTKSKTLSIQLQSLLLRFGILSKVKEVYKIATNTRFRGKYFDIVVYGVDNFEKFSNNIQLIHNKKRFRVKNLLNKKSNTNLDVIEVNDLIKEITESMGISVKKAKKDFPKLDAYCYNQCLPSRNGVQQLLQKVLTAKSEEVKILQTIAEAHIYWDEIIECESIKSNEEWVYDLCVEEDHNFIANNIFVHNSNVLDSLCFVLGKSSSKSLRAEKSANLIYNGGKTKQPSKIAEVSIYFDNKNKTFPLSEDEIKITRLVRHDGLSKYKINGKTRTRQEMLELLSSAKIDPDGYNIILQGDIIRMIEMSSIERRQVIEEIAGISVYEEKKQQAINELTKVDQKISEAEIILKERETYLKELKKDRDHALKYKELTDSLKKNKASYAKKKFDSKTEDLNKLVQKSSEFKDKLNKINEGIKNLREQINTKKEEIKKINEEIESKGEVEQVKLQKHVESLKVELATAKTKINSSQKETEKIEQRKSNYAKNLEEVEQKIKEFEAQKKSFEETKQNQQNELEQLEQTIKEFKLKHGIETSNQLEQEIDKIDRESEELQKSTHSLREEHQNQLREKDKNEFQLQTIEQRIEKVLELEKEHKKEIDLLKKMKNEFKKAVLELNELLNQDSLKARELGQKRESLLMKQEELSKMELKHANMKESIHANIAVQKILEKKAGLGEVYGTVSELGSVSSKYSLSLEIAAGHKIHSIVVEDDKTAAKCIKYLKENKFGVATFLPINKVRTFPQTQEATKLAEEKGVHGFATDLVKYDKKFKNIFSYVFGNTLVVDNIDTSRKLGIGSVRTVTIDGDLTEPSGAMIGGYRHKNFGSFKDNEIEEKIDKSKKETELLESEITNVESWRKESDEKITRLREVKANLEGDIIKTEKSLHLDSGDLIASQQYKEELEEQLKKNNSAIIELESKLNDLTEKVVQLKIKRQELRNKATELRKPTILAQLNAFDEKRKELSESVIKMDAELRNIEVQSNEVGYKERENVLNSLKIFDEEKNNFEKEIEILSEEIKEKEKELEQKEEDQKEFYAQYKSLFDKRNKEQDLINSCESKVLVQEEKSRQEELQINTFSIEEARIKAELAGIDVEISQYPGVELDLEKSEEEFKKLISSQERSLSAIGNVNMRALEIYEITEKEYNGLIEKKESLKVEKEEVLSLMNEIEGSKKDLFMNSLNVINENFKRIFLDLSTKGEAFLEVENLEKLFEEGIRIKVKLTGEKFLDIRSLSGGEKTMTALAFLFAIQEHEPASFYVLDEVDAALDKHNSQLLANLIRKYCQKAQYIVISHNDAVISEADILYGVSMKKDAGISQVVSLAMEEAKARVQEMQKEEVSSSK